MKKQEPITAFYLETLVLIVVFLSIILVLTQVFGLGRMQSAQARELTDAVCLAQNAAEAVAAADSPEAVAATLNEANNARLSEGRIEAGYNADRSPNSSRAPAYWVYVEWTPEEDGLARCEISVRLGDPWGAEPLYTLETAVYVKEAGA